MSRTAARQRQVPVQQVPATPLWIVSVWAIILALIFFRYRGDDLGRMSQILSALPRAFQGFQISALRDSLLGAVASLLTVIAWFGYGDAIEDAVVRVSGAPARRHSIAWLIALKCAWGAGVTSLLMLLVGVTRLYTKTVAAIGLAVGVALFVRALRRLSRTSAADEARSGLGKLALAFIAIPVLLAAVAALAPPIAKDTLLYHISLPKAFLDARGLADVRYNIAQFYALGAELNGTWAMLLGRYFNLSTGEAAFGFTQFAYFPLVLLAVYGWMRGRGSSRAESLLPAALVACVPTFFSSASSGYNDCALALYVTFAIVAAADWWQSPDRRSAIELGLAIGFGLCIKLLTVFLVAPLILLLLLRLREAKSEPSAVTRSILATAAIAVLIGAAVAAPWYVRNWIRTGSPVFPFYMNIFGGSAPGWDQQRSIVDQILNARYGGYPKGIFDYFAVPFRLSLAAQPEEPLYFDGVLGISFLVGLPVLLYAAIRKKLDTEFKVAAGLSGVFFLAWLFTSEQLRYLLPALPALAVATCAASLVLDRRFRAVLLATALPGLLVIGAWFLQQNPVAVVAGAEPRDAYLERTLDHYKIYETVNSSLPRDARVWLINMRRDTYYLDRSYFSDFRIEHYTLLNMVESSSSAAEMLQRAHQMGITHVLFRADTLLDPRTTPIFYDRLSAAENEQKFQIMREFLLGGTVLKNEGRFVLVQLK